MIIQNIEYTRSKEGVFCSTSACLTMLLHAYGKKVTLPEIGDEFNKTILSRDFMKWYTCSFDSGKNENYMLLSCANYIINRNYPDLHSDILISDISKIGMSYTKRKIPVIVNSLFPMLYTMINSSILVTGFSEEYLIVNDPRGNANTGYKERYGENVIYSNVNLNQWTGGNTVPILRILK